MTHEERKYAFILDGEGIDFYVYYVFGTNESNALIKYCKYTGEIKGAHMEAICSLCFESAVQLANEWLCDRIIGIHEVANEIFSVPDFKIEIIK